MTDPDLGQARRPDPRRWWALALLCLAFFMVILDSQIVILALPAIQRHLGFSPDGGQWVLSAYLLSFGGLLLLGGRAADLLGRRRMFLVGSLLFGASSLLCGLAWSPAALVSARVIQGCSAALLAPSALSILITTFAEGPERNKALGIWSATGGVGATAALLIGGPLTDAAGWRWIFLINLPVAAVMLSFAPRLFAESRGRLARRVYDLPGAVTITAGLVAIVYAIVRAPIVGWADARTIAPLLVGAALIAVFATVEQHSPVPLLRFGLLRSRALVGGNLVVLTLGTTAWGMGLTVSLYAQRVLGYTPLGFGLAQSVMTLMTLVGSGGAQALVTRTGPGPIAAGGLALTGIGCLLLSGVPVDGSYVSDLLPALLVFGLGLGSTFVAGSVAALTSVAEHESGVASSLNNAAFQIGGALGSAIATSVAVAHTTGSGQLDALTHGYQAAFVAALICAVIGVALATIFLTKRPRRRSARAPLGEAKQTGSSGGRREAA